MKKVLFVGAGPGDPELITIKGMKAIKEADVIIYAGSLVNPALLEYASNTAKIYNSATMTLEETYEVMSTSAKDDKSVVRLHTGDPSLYGAIEEQMALLDKEGIEYETIPGVSACFGAAASLNLEYTLPDISQSLIITRMEGRTKVPPLESIESFAAHKSTMAIYLSAGMLGELSKRLIKGGYDKDTKAAIIYKATWPEEKVCICTIDTLEKTAADNDIHKTALIIVGDVLNKSGYMRSKLYDPEFSTEYREASR